MTKVPGEALTGHDDQVAAAISPMPSRTRRIPAGMVTAMLATAARAPSVHNTQPWRFAVGPHAIDLYADPARKLRQDRAGREMLISCGAALFGLRLGVRELGYLPAVSLFPEPSLTGLLARVTLGPKAPPTALERRMLAALPHRHTHRGAFDPGALVAEATRMQARNPAARAEILRWSRAPGSPARDGVPATAFAPAGAAGPGR